MSRRIVLDDEQSGGGMVGNRSGRLPTQYTVTREDLATLAGVTVEAVYRAEKRGRLRLAASASADRHRLDLASVVEWLSSRRR